MLFLLEQIIPAKYDQVSGFVIRAESEEQARKMANEEHWEEGAIWNDSGLVSCDEINADGENEIIIIDRNPG